jgi:hypothetical protein
LLQGLLHLVSLLLFRGMECLLLVLLLQRLLLLVVLE